MSKLLRGRVSMLVGLACGILASTIFTKARRPAAVQDEAPRTYASKGWPDVLVGAALQGAIFVAVSAALDRLAAAGTPLAHRYLPGRGQQFKNGREGAIMTEPDAVHSTSTPGTAQRELPRKPTDLGGRSWRAAGRRTLTEFKDDFLQDRAAALTYYGVLAIFPGILVLVSLLGLFSKPATQPLITNLGRAMPGSVRTIVLSAVDRLQHGHSTAGAVAIVGILLALWSTSGYVAAFMRASNTIYDVPEGRPARKTLPVRFGLTVALMVLLVASAVIVVVTGGLARHVGQVLGIGSAAVTAWGIAKWPVLFILVCLMIGLLYWASPNVRHGLRWIGPGAVLAVAIWLIASGLFTLYVANFGHYNKVYGSIAGMIIFLIWLWISNTAILFGAEFNAELERSRAIAAGTPPDAEPFVELRDTRKLRQSGKQAGKSAA